MFPLPTVLFFWYDGQVLIRIRRKKQPARRVRIIRKAEQVIVMGAWVRVPKDAVNMAHVRAHLTLRNPEFWFNQEHGESTEGLEPLVFLFKEKGPYVYLPRHFKFELLRDLPVRRIPFSTAQVKQLTTKIQPRNAIQEKAMAAFEGDQDGILCLAPGTGKTLVSLMIAARNKRFPLLVVVHTTALFDQWRKELTRAYGIHPTNIGTVRGPVCSWRGKSVAIAMLQSLSKRKYAADFYAHWRLVVIDEVHRAGSLLWQKVAPMFHAQRIGLTATPDRPDGMDKAFRVHIGRIRYQYTKQPLTSEFVFVHTGITIKAPAMRNPMKRWAIVMSIAGKNEVRNALISRVLKNAYNEGRKVIVLGERVQTLKDLCADYPGKNKALFVGEVERGAARELALSKDAIFATASMAKEGLDVPRLDTLFITIPFSGLGRLSQSVGRILRTEEGKMQPRTYVFVDHQPSIQNNAAKNRAWALSKGYAVRDIYPGEY